MIKYLRFKTTDSGNPTVLMPVGGGIYAQRHNNTTQYLVPYDNPNYQYKIVNTGLNESTDPKLTIAINSALANASSTMWKEPISDVVNPVGITISSITLQDATDTL